MEIHRHSVGLNHILNKQSNGRHQSVIIYDDYMLLNVFLIENRVYCNKCQTIIINALALLSMKQLLWHKKEILEQSKD